MRNDKTTANERRLIHKMVEMLSDKGWALTNVFDDGELHDCRTAKKAIEICESVDQASIIFSRNNRCHKVVVIMGNGNDGWDVVTDYDYSETDNFYSTMETFEAWVNKEQELAELAA